MASMGIIGSPLRAVVVRWLGYLALWVALIGIDLLDLLVGGLAAAIAARASLRLLPPGAHPVRVAGLPRLALRFLAQSVSAGIDVARRAFSPSMPLRPGFLQYPTHYGRGPARNAFASITSLLPGTLAVRDDAQGILYHCLDLSQPVAADLAAEEATVSRALPQAQSR
jgi:multicomponent Na+:H+ antiporter subunit E